MTERKCVNTESSQLISKPDRCNQKAEYKMKNHDAYVCSKCLVWAVFVEGYATFDDFVFEDNQRKDGE